MWLSPACFSSPDRGHQPSAKSELLTKLCIYSVSLGRGKTSVYRGHAWTQGVVDGSRLPAHALLKALGVKACTASCD